MNHDFQINQYELMETFNDSNCPKLRRTPKFFVFNYCQGDRVDEGVWNIETSFDELNAIDAMPTVSID